MARQTLRDQSPRSGRLHVSEPILVAEQVKHLAHDPIESVLGDHADWAGRREDERNGVEAKGLGSFEKPGQR